MKGTSIKEEEKMLISLSRSSILVVCSFDMCYFIQIDMQSSANEHN